MKQFIVLAAVLPIMLVFITQFTLEAVRSLRMNAAEDCIRAFCIDVSYYGGGSAEDETALKNRLANLFKTEASEVTVELSPRQDNKHVDWRISFPVGDIMAGGLFMGLTPNENRGFAQMEGTIVIAPKPPPPADPEQQDEDPADPGPQDQGQADPGPADPIAQVLSG